MKIKYNFGLLKELQIGFLNPVTKMGFHGPLKKVTKKKGHYQFLYDDRFIEISEDSLLCSILEEIDHIYYFIPQNKPTINGLFLYSMYDTYGFPMEMTKEILEEKGYSVDINGYQLIKKIQKEKNHHTFKNKNAFS
ncbi:MAG: alanine--tRNA ligase-related protein [Eubacteriales bacterium]|nr:alanine--tRNA ligase-related protein [Eubacteriales bacterium]